MNGHEQLVQDQYTGVQGGTGTGMHEAPFLAVPRQADFSFGLVGDVLFSTRGRGIGFKFSLYYQAHGRPRKNRLLSMMKSTVKIS